MFVIDGKTYSYYTVQGRAEVHRNEIDNYGREQKFYAGVIYLENIQELKNIPAEDRDFFVTQEMVEEYIKNHKEKFYIRR